MTVSASVTFTGQGQRYAGETLGSRQPSGRETEGVGKNIPASLRKAEQLVGGEGRGSLKEEK